MRGPAFLALCGAFCAAGVLSCGGSGSVNTPPAPQFTLTLAQRGSGKGTVSALPQGPTYAEGTPVTVTENPNDSSTFGGWSGACSGTGICSVTMTANDTVTATFNARPVYTLTMNTTGPGSGTVSASPPGPRYFGGTQVTVTATPDSASTFDGWSGACSGTGGCSVLMSANAEVTATFNMRDSLAAWSGTWSGTLADTETTVDTVTGSRLPSPGTAATLLTLSRTGSTLAGTLSVAGDSVLLVSNGVLSGTTFTFTLPVPAYEASDPDCAEFDLHGVAVLLRPDTLALSVGGDLCRGRTGPTLFSASGTLVRQ